MTSTINATLQQLYGDTMPIAVIGAGCRMPQSDDIFEYWRKLADGEELIQFFDADKLAAAGVDPALLQQPGYVPAAAIVDGADRFDWSFFGYSRQEAESIDPQQRLFLMCAWEALEMSGHPPGVLAGQGDTLKIGVIGACKMSSYPAAHFDKMQEIASPRTFARLIGNDKDYLATRVSYKLGLTGPSFTVQTACSSSLVAIHIACEQLASGECDMVLAGGAGIGFPQEAGYFHREGMIFSPDGHCRPFDAGANGTAIGNGAAVVLLKSLDRALADGDPILAVVRGSAVNNDGNGKAGYTAPSPEGQARVIGSALALAEVDPASIGLVEAHGTATPLGDPIEVEALTRAWRRHTTQTQFCALGSVKSNLGHLDTAAGVASFLKAALALHFGQIPPSLHYDQANPAIDFEASPFFVPKMLLPWPQQDGPRRAAVSSFAIGGTNCHAVLEQAPPAPRDEAANGPLLLILSARSESALRALARRHAWRLAELDSQTSLADYCASSVFYRSLFEHRLALLADDADSFSAALHAFAEGDDSMLAVSRQGAVRAWSATTAESDLQAFVSAQLLLAQPAWDGHPVCGRQPAIRALLPTCPFEGERCWYTVPAKATIAAPADHPAGHPADDAWQAVAVAARHSAATLGESLDLSALEREAQGVDALHAAYVGTAFATLGVFAEPDQWLDVDTCLRRASAPQRYRDLFRRLLRDLAAFGALERRGDAAQAEYRNLRSADLPDPQPWLAVMRELGYEQLAELVERSGPRLAEMVSGQVDPVSVVFPGAATDNVEHMYQEQPYSVYLNRIAAAAAAALAGAKRPLRILEVGGGTGGTTRDVLAQLPAGACQRYTFTDLGPLFLQRARSKFAAFPFMQYQRFDMNESAVGQGLEAGGYDLIVAANVLHNAPDLRVVLANLASVLAPGGMLLMREITEAKKLFDFVFGPLVPALSDTDTRNGELFASGAVWKAALADAGFAQYDAFPGPELASHALGEQILLARLPGLSNAAIAAQAPAIVLQQPTPGAILAAVLAQVPDRRRSRLEEVRWHIDPSGAPTPLRLKVETAAGQLEAGFVDSQGLSQRLLTARVTQPRALATRHEGDGGLPLAPHANLLDQVADAQALDMDSLYWPLADAGGALRLHGGAVVTDAGGAVRLAVTGMRAPIALAGLAQLYRWTWQPAPAAANGVQPKRVVWLGATTASDMEALSDAFDSLGISCVFRSDADLRNKPDAMRAWLAQRGKIDALCYTPALTTPGAAASLLDASGAAPLIALLAALPADCPLTVLGAGMFALEPDDTAEGWAGAGLAAVLAVARQETPALRAMMVDTGKGSPADVARGLVQLWSSATPAPVYALRGGQLHQQQLAPAALPSAPALAPGRHVLIGGLCELGRELAQWLVSRGARDLVVLARREPTDAENSTLDLLRAQGAAISIDPRADAADAAAFDAALERLADGAPVAAVYHLAGIVRDAPLTAMQASDWEAVLATKLVPALRLHALEARLRPAATVYFSSAATAFGPAGQGAHALANAMLEGLAQHRSRLGLDTLALAWGYWGEIGADARIELAARLGRQGMLGMSTAQGCALLGHAMGGADAIYVPCKVDWNRFAATATTTQARHFAPCWPQGAAAPIAPIAPIASFAAPSGDLAARVRASIAAVLGCDSDAIDGDTRLIQLGLDSLLLLDLMERIRDEFGVTVSADTVFNADTPNAFTAALAAQLGQAPATATAPAPENGSLARTLRSPETTPQTARPLAQRYLRTQLAALLQCPEGDIGADAELLQLGLDSLLFLELSETIQRDLGVPLSAETAFQNGTLNALAEALAALLHPAQANAANDAAPALRQGLTELQQRDGSWLAPNGDILPRPAGTPVSLHGLRRLRHQLRADDLPQQLYVEYDKPASFDLARFEQAWNQLIARHAMLRTTIEPSGQLRTMETAPTYAIGRSDLHEHAPAMREKELASRRHDMARAAPDLAVWPHFEWHASRLDSATVRLHLRLDTTLVDIESLRIMLRELHLWMGDPERRLPPLQFSAQDYYASEQALAGTTAHAGQRAVLAAAMRALPPPPQLPRARDAIPADAGRIAVWRAALPRADWLRLKEHALASGLSGTAVMLAVYATALASWSERADFSLRLDYPDRKPFHAQAMNVMLDASDSAIVACHVGGGVSFMDLARSCADSIRLRLAADLVDGASVLADGGGMAPVAMTSLLGVRTTYAIPETSDPLLGMPTFEIASQPGTALHFQVLEEESALLYNIDLRADLLPEELGAALMARLQVVLAALAAGPQAWQLAPPQLAQREARRA